MDIQFLIELGVGLLFVGYSIHLLTEYGKARIQGKTKQTTLANQKASNPLSRYESFTDLLSQLTEALDMQAKTIAKELDKQKKDPMTDTGYMTVVKQYQTALQWKQRIESPIGQIADSMVFPFAKRFSGRMVKDLEQMMKGGF